MAAAEIAAAATAIVEATALTTLPNASKLTHLQFHLLYL